MGVLEGGGADTPFGEHEREVQFFSFAGLGLEGGGADTRMNSAVRPTRWTYSTFHYHHDANIVEDVTANIELDDRGVSVRRVCGLTDIAICVVGLEVVGSELGADVDGLWFG
jgi:hypothetical protein